MGRKFEVIDVRSNKWYSCKSIAGGDGRTYNVEDIYDNFSCDIGNSVHIYYLTTATSGPSKQLLPLFIREVI